MADDLPDPGVTDEDGAALAVVEEDGAAGPGVVESCAEIKCGPCQGSGCCFCANPFADPGDPCFHAYPIGNLGFLPPEKFCNASASCCGGSTMRVGWQRQGTASYRRTKKFGDQAYEERKVSLVAHLNYETQIVKDPKSGQCVQKTTLLDGYYKLVEFLHQYNGQESQQTVEYTDPETVLGAAFVGLTSSKDIVRPECVATAAYGGLISSPQSYPWGPYLGADSWGEVLFKFGASGQLQNDDKTTLQSWNTSAACLKWNGGASVTTNAEDNFYITQYSMSQSAAMGAKTLVDDCCPKGPGGPGVGLPGENPVGNVGQPGNLTGGGCLKCGGVMRGDLKCGQCGWCWGCGG